MRISALLLSLVLAAQAWAAWPYDAVCDLQNETPQYFPDGSRGYPGGSGTLIGVSDRTGLILSCAHAFENGGRTAKISFASARGEWRGRVIGLEPQNDLSMLVIDSPPDIATPMVRAAKPEDGPFVCVGYPWYGRDRQHWTAGECIGLTADSRIHVRCSVQSGYSGGALFNKHGEICGVVCGMTGPNRDQMDRAYCPSGEALLRFVGRWMEVER